jgi:hypothetical protein
MHCSSTTFLDLSFPLNNKDIKVTRGIKALTYIREEKRPSSCHLCVSFDLYFKNCSGSLVFMDFYYTEIPLNFSCLK